jgi:hypothetical protein
MPQVALGLRRALWGRLRLRLRPWPWLLRHLLLCGDDHGQRHSGFFRHEGSTA